MSYQVIARKWRPQRFDEVTGQSHVTTPLRNAIRSGRVPHAILLTGPRGVGKTTIARILARCLNCEKGPTDSPCGSCSSCHEIAAGSSTDVQEIDAASRTGVDDVRELIETIRYAPSPGKHRIFVVDEVHMLSTAAFNALLKTLEEPPPRSLFVFATTNPEKIPFTVLSRCQRYDLRLFSTAEVAARLGEICRADGIEISESSLLAVAREGQGSMRDAQTLLDQVIAYGGTEVANETVSSVLDLIDRRVLLDITKACIEGDPAAALAACQLAIGSGTDPRRLCAALIQLLRDLVVLRVAPDVPGLVEGSPEDVAELRAIAESESDARLRRMFRALIQEQEDLGWAPQPFAVLEMALVRLATMPAGDDVSQLLSRLEQLERRLAGSGPVPGGDAGGGGGSGGARTAGGRGSAGGTAKRATEPGREDATPAAARDQAPARAEAIATHSEAPAEGAPLPVVLDRLRVFAGKRDRGLFAALDGAELLERRAGQLTLAAPSAFHLRRLQDRIELLSETCGEFFGQPTRVEVVAGKTPSQGQGADTESDRELERRRRQQALNHPSINTALEVLDAEIVEIRPLGDQPARKSGKARSVASAELLSEEAEAR